MKLYVLKYFFTNPKGDKEERISYYTKFQEVLDRYEDLQDKWYALDITIYRATYSEETNMSRFFNPTIIRSNTK